MVDASALGSVDISGTLASAGLPSSVQGVLQGAGLTGDALSSAVTQLTGIDSNAQGAILSIAGQVANTKSFSPAALAPLIAAGFAATGVGAPIAAAITLGLPLVTGLANALNPAPQYQWLYRPDNYGVPHGDFQSGSPKGTRIPYGPSDSHWVTFEKFMATEVPVVNKLKSIIDSSLNLDAVVPGLNEQWIESTDTGSSGGTRGVPAAANAFRLIYNAAWRKNYEYIINGHNWVDPYQLLVTVAGAWNATHAPTSSVLLTPVMGPAYIAQLLNGDFDGQDHQPVPINTGAAQAAQGPKPVVMAAAPTKVISLKLGVRPAASAPVATSVSAPGAMVVPLTIAKPSLWSRLLPFTPVVVGAALFPVAGIVAPLVGGAASALWVELRK